MELTEALFIFIGGAISHAFVSRMLGINIKLRVYRTALINCLGITKYASRHSEKFLLAACGSEADKPLIREAIKYWQNLSVLSLKNSTPPEVWSSLGIKDWATVEKVIHALEEVRSQDEQI